ncbi:hypothetical protein RB195_022766 [Necator americanus]|uniref:Isopropylmalate dehydrogenase-like domain-containing protein n=1 Tax=Necator americanus TaxID=51031 RepID=A0ABR1EJ34_NECAM
MHDFPLQFHLQKLERKYLIGGAGVVTGQSVGSDYVIFEPGSRHSFQQALGRSIANPTAMILCAANMLKHLHLHDYGSALQTAVEKVVKDGKIRTRDMGGYASTTEFADAVVNCFEMTVRRFVTELLNGLELPIALSD